MSLLYCIIIKFLVPRDDQDEAHRVSKTADRTNVTTYLQLKHIISIVNFRINNFTIYLIELTQLLTPFAAN